MTLVYGNYGTGVGEGDWRKELWTLSTGFQGAPLIR